MTLKIDIVSDLHVDAWFSTTKLHDPAIRMWEGEPYNSEFLHVDWQFYKNPDSRVLIIAGDTSNDIMEAAQVAECASRVYEHVIIVDGNHEHYSDTGTVSVNMASMRDRLSKHPNLIYLEGSNHVIIDGVLFVGATGWYDWRAYEDRFIHQSTAYQAWARYSRDSHYPNYAELGDPEKLAIIQSTQIAEVVRSEATRETVASVVVVTHMSPRSDIMEWRDDDRIWNELTPSYVNTSLSRVLEADTENKIKCWVYGHTHYRREDDIDGVKYVNNARGYPRENEPMSLKQVAIPN